MSRCWTRTETIGSSVIALAAALVMACSTGGNSLSVLVGGVMGLANLRLWRGIVAGWLMRPAGRKGVSVLLAGQCFLKVVLLAAVIWVVLRTPLAPWGVLVGFGAALVGQAIAAFTATE